MPKQDTSIADGGFTCYAAVPALQIKHSAHFFCKENEQRGMPLIFQ